MPSSISSALTPSPGNQHRPSERTGKWTRTSTSASRANFKLLGITGGTIRGVYGREMFGTWRKMLGLIHGGLDMSPLITHRLPFREYQAGFDAMRSGQSGKVVLNW